MKCPFCGEELRPTYDGGFHSCFNLGCKAAFTYMPKDLLMAIAALQTKLVKATEGLEQIVLIYRRAYQAWEDSCNDMYDTALDTLQDMRDTKE